MLVRLIDGDSATSIGLQTRWSCARRRPGGQESARRDTIVAPGA